jgi:hypothetical protein
MVPADERDGVIWFYLMSTTFLDMLTGSLEIV